MLMVLGLIDVVMIANLLIMVIIGGYETFVSRLHLDDHHDQPEWLSHVNAGMLKVKLATALISISSIHLLKTFITVQTQSPVNNHGTMWQVIIHVVFVLSAIALAWTDRPAISVQFHPEFEPGYAKALIAARRDRMPQPDAAIASLDRPNDNARIAAWIRRFLTAPKEN